MMLLHVCLEIDKHIGKGVFEMSEVLLLWLEVAGVAEKGKRKNRDFLWDLQLHYVTAYFNFIIHETGRICYL